MICHVQYWKGSVFFLEWIEIASTAHKGIVNGEVACTLYYNMEKGGYWWVHYFHFPYIGTQIYLKAKSLEEAKRDSEKIFIQNCKEAVDKYTSMLNACIKQPEVEI